VGCAPRVRGPDRSRGVRTVTGPEMTLLEVVDELRAYGASLERLRYARGRYDAQLLTEYGPGRALGGSPSEAINRALDQLARRRARARAGPEKLRREGSWVTADVWGFGAETP